MKTEILGVSFDALTNEKALSLVLSYLQNRGGPARTVVTPGPEMLVYARTDSEFKSVLNNADMVLADGIGVYLSAKLNKVNIPERVTGCDLSYAIFGAVKDTPRTVYLFGAGKGVAEAAKANMELKFPGLKIIGVHDGYFNAAEEARIIEEIRELKPDILLAGLGFPKQERWIYDNKDLPVGVMLAVGGTIDVMAGNVKSAPDAFRKLGLEWLYRLIKQPSRFSRMLRLPVFAWLVVCNKFLNQFRLT